MNSRYPPTQEMNNLSIQNHQLGTSEQSQQSYYGNMQHYPDANYGGVVTGVTANMQPFGGHNMKTVGPPGGMMTGPPGGMMTVPTSGGMMTGPPPTSGGMMRPPGGMTAGPPPTSGGMMRPPGGMMGPPGGMTTGPPPTSGGMMRPPGGMMGPPPTSGGMTTGPPPTSGGMMRPPGGMTAGPPPTSGGMMRPPGGMMTGPPGGMMTGPPPTSGGMMRPPGGMMTGPPGGMMTGPPPTSGGMTTGPPGGMTNGHQMTGIPPGQMSGPPGGTMAGPPGRMMSGPPSGTMAGPPGGMMSRPPGGGPPGGMMSGPPGGTMAGPPGGMMSGPPGGGPPGGMMSGPPCGTMAGPPGGMMSGPPGGGPPGGMMSGPPGGTMAGPPGGMMSGPPGGTMAGPPGGMMSGPIQSQPTRQAPTKIDPDMMPNPISVMKENRDKYGGSVYGTSQATPPPLVTTPFTVHDQGSSSPRYIRSTLYTVPCTKDLVNQCRIPLGVIIQPLAEVPMTENNLAVVDHGVNGPIRCNRCKAYMNPHCQFVSGGREYICPICECHNEVVPEYFSHLDHTGRRIDVQQHPELLYGTVEYVATKDYCKEGRLPDPPAYIFMIDVSVSNMESALVSLLSHTMLSILDNLPRSNDGTSPVKVGFMTYDRIIHFYNVKENLAQPQMMVVSDMADVFVPLVDGFLVNIDEARSVIENLMGQLPDMFGGSKEHYVVFEPAVRAGMEALKAAKCNGRLFMFHSNLPTHQAPGQLKSRLDTKLLGTDKEKSLLNSVGGPYSKLAEECVKNGVALDLFLFPSSYTDIATLGSLASTTGGQIHLYPNFQTPIDGERLFDNIVSCINKPIGFDAVMRVRCSAGIRAVNFYGGFYMNNTTDIEFGNIDTDKAVAVEIKHDDKMKENTPAYIQAALLYTTVFGQRRLRVHNLVLNCSGKFSDIYHSCDLDTLMGFFVKSVINGALSMPYKSIRETFTHQCAVILACYRKNCSQQSPPGQLILPDSLKLLPMYANCLLKSDSVLSPPIVSLDEKCFQMYYAMRINLRRTIQYLYPTMISLSSPDIDENSTLRCTGQKMQDDGIYLIDNGLVMVIWVGQQAPPDLINKLFGVASIAQINLTMHSLPALDNDVSFKVRAELKKMADGRQRKLIITKQRDGSEMTFRRMLKEDKGSGPWEGMSYIDYLCQLHKEIREML